MAFFVDRVIFLPAAGGTGSFVVSSAVTGYLTPAQAGATTGASYRYAAETRHPGTGAVTAWEVGTGGYTSATTTLTRVPEFSSNSNALVNFASAPNVMITALAADLGLPNLTGWIDVYNYATAAQQASITAQTGTDVTAAVTAAIAALPSTGGVLYFRPGRYVTTGSFIITVPIMIVGAGNGFSGGGQITVVECSTGNNIFMKFTAEKAEVRDINIVCTAVSPVAGSKGFLCQHASNEQNAYDFNSVYVEGFDYAIDIQTAGGFSMYNCTCVDYINRGLNVANVLNTDAGGWRIVNSGFSTSSTDGIGLYWNSSGGASISNTKFGGTNFSRGIYANLTGASGQFQVSNVSVDGSLSSAVEIHGNALYYGINFDNCFLRSTNAALPAVKFHGINYSSLSNSMIQNDGGGSGVVVDSCTHFTLGAGNVYNNCNPQFTDGGSNTDLKIVRETITANRSFFVRTTGSDSNNGDTSGTAFLTLQACMNFISTFFDSGDFIITIDLGAGSFAGLGLKEIVGGGTLYLNGASTATTTIVSGPADGVYNNGECISVYRPLTYVFHYNNVKLAVTGGVGSSNIAVFAAVNILTGAPGSLTGAIAHVCAGAGCYSLFLEAPGLQYVDPPGVATAISGNGVGYAFVDFVCGVAFEGTYTLSGTPVYTAAFLEVDDNAVVLAIGTFAGTGATGTRYIVTSGGGINTFGAGAAYLPGSVAGTNDGTGFYV